MYADSDSKPNHSALHHPLLEQEDAVNCSIKHTSLWMSSGMFANVGVVWNFFMETL